MGHVFADIVLSNPRREELAPVAAKALADTGALMLCIPERIAVQLQLEAESTREVAVADGRSVSVPYVGPIRVTFGNRLCFVGALVLGDEVLLGAVPMEDMDLVVNPGRREVTVDPASPNFAHARVKCAQPTATRPSPTSPWWRPPTQKQDAPSAPLPEATEAAIARGTFRLFARGHGQSIELAAPGELRPDRTCAIVV